MRTALEIMATTGASALFISQSTEGSSARPHAHASAQTPRFVRPSPTNLHVYTGWSKKNGATLHFPKNLENY